MILNHIFCAKSLIFIDKVTPSSNKSPVLQVHNWHLSGRQVWRVPVPLFAAKSFRLHQLWRAGSPGVEIPYSGAKELEFPNHMIILSLCYQMAMGYTGDTQFQTHPYNMI